ncbi:MAG: hypothetical protein C4617_03075 [Candidatus Liberibacter europaeus]|uniref:L,D-TPase catalytic domain-containing protein n=1 Tax=Candidatus Liberibacter europaeus TaxID=744859 RepID=A0A2T4VYE2_9HYPH|nr:hypothetical protein [Candidatus Liberibacter europaeus]PTL86795.1 MAG: hypothetical protein C4617_03075 [Candidatus Liberibacter europaeus]
MISFYSVFLFICLLLLNGCSSTGYLVDKAEYPMTNRLIGHMNKNKTNRYYPCLIRIFKKENVLEIWKYTTDKKYALFKSYKICAWSGLLGPKVEIGDMQSPEGFYQIKLDSLNPNSKYYLSINVGFPNEFDAANDRTGTDIMIHGGCSSSGCYAMNDRQMQEIYIIVRDALRGNIKPYVQLQSFPFRMTRDNMERYREHPSYPFWQVLKIGYDYFEITNKEPIIQVVNKQYVFFKE